MAWREHYDPKTEPSAHLRLKTLHAHRIVSTHELLPFTVW
jgi:hypothetical protein